ncbi:MAG: hypothetical protein J1F12_08270 [Muribaculaceae bacterium]|nr:hypothetical protein [Muribaculaceae bacterium]
MMKKYLFIALCLSILFCTGCSKKTAVTTAYKTYDTECLGTDPSGAQILRVWGSGKDYNQAVENAGKKAVEEVTFNHITNGAGDCNAWPVIDSPVARRNNSEYFAKFFKHKGNYRKYITTEKPDKDKAMIGNDRVVVPVIVTVNRESLRQKFVKDKIID